MTFVTSSISPRIQASPPGRIKTSANWSLASDRSRSGRTFIPPMLRTGFLVRPTVSTANPNVRRSSASADAGSQSANPSNTKTYVFRVSIMSGPGFDAVIVSPRQAAGTLRFGLGANWRYRRLRIDSPMTRKREGSLEALPGVLSRYAGKSCVPWVSVRGSY